MKTTTITTTTYTFQNGDVIAHRLGAGAIVSLVERHSTPGSWFANGQKLGITDEDIQNNLECHSDRWQYLGNKYEPFAKY